MAIVADYLVVARAVFSLKLGTVSLPDRNDMSFTVTFPAGTALDRGEPILHYVADVGLTAGQIGIAVDVNGAEVHRRTFLGQRDVFCQAIVSGSAFHAGNNTLRFRPVVPNNNTTQSIMFSSVVLWFQRDTAAAG